MDPAVADEGPDRQTKRVEYRYEDEEEAEEDHNAPSRWWFSSTLFPLVAGTFGPMATAFSICALAIDWRLVVNPASTETEGYNRSDPQWYEEENPGLADFMSMGTDCCRLIAVNAVSLAIAIIANLALLANNFGRLPFHVAQPATILGWYTSSFMLIGLVAAAPAHLPLPIGENRTFSQAYYYAILAAAVYFICASLLVATSAGVYLGQHSEDFKLTFAQRTLMIQVLLFLGYLLAAGAVYAKIEGWDFLDAVYYIDVTLFTIGFGDFSPKTHLGRSLFFPMAIGGILFVGLIVASISSLVLDRGSKKVSIRMVERARQKALKDFDPKTGAVKLSPLKKPKVGKGVSTELDRREQEFDIMREVQKTAANYNRMIALSVSLGSVLILWFIGAVCFWQAEKGGQDWSYFESLYFTYVALLTIGYGDFYPQDNSAKPVFVFWSLMALPTLTVLIGAVGGVINEGVNTLTLWIGDHLPEKGALAAVKGEAAKTKGGEFQSAKPPGFMEDGRADDAGTNDPAHAEAVKGISQSMHQNGGGTSEDRSAGKHFRHYLLMKEMKNVVQHMDATPPRLYTYSEWTWFLKLLGEDESDPERHRRAERVHSAELAADAADATEHDKRVRDEKGDVRPWSWLGRRSPLMVATDEPKWVLERLMDALEKELKEQGEGNLERERRVNGN
ncbi:hypothetical protein P7C71_g1875, partial [Lecanoromycetidae sp. Uapishka_2]